VRENVSFAAVKPGDVDALVAAAGLADAADFFPRDLSYGMRQRVAVMRTIAAGAQIILLDEPLSSVDLIRRIDLENHLTHTIRAAGRTAIWVTHDLDEAIAVGQRIVLVAGRPLQIVGDMVPAAPRWGATRVRTADDFQRLHGQLFGLITQHWSL